MEAVASGHAPPRLMTYRQVLALGRAGAKGASGLSVIYFSALMKGRADGGKMQGGFDEEAREVRFLQTLGGRSSPSNG